MNFWKGFINIQNSIHSVDNLKVIAHSWNSEYDELVKNIYDINTLLSEKQTSYINEFMPYIIPVNKFEKAFSRSGSTWDKI